MVVVVDFDIMEWGVGGGEGVFRVRSVEGEGGVTAGCGDIEFPRLEIRCYQQFPSRTKYTHVLIHIWESPIIHYQNFRVNYPYPFFGVVLW